jgi:ABC-type Zn2+ transport system substrate-binding protein/surface adhesin
LQFVHLEFPPHKSHFWRWHNRGDGMLSTIEAVYFAAREVSAALQIQKRQIQDIIIDETNNENDEDNNNKGNNNQRSRHHREDLDDDYDESVDHHQQRCGFVNILWLFALQRSIIEERSIQEGRPVAFSEEAKSIARALRKKFSM